MIEKERPNISGKVIRMPRTSNEEETMDIFSGIAYNEIRKGLKEQAATMEGVLVDWQEKYLDKLDRDIGQIKNSLRDTEERIAGMINQTLSEMRDRDNQRHAEILALRSDIQAIRSDNAETRRWVIGMVISAIGVALAAIIGVVSIAYQVFK